MTRAGTKPLFPPFPPQGLNGGYPHNRAFKLDCNDGMAFGGLIWS